MLKKSRAAPESNLLLWDYIMQVCCLVSIFQSTKHRQWYSLAEKAMIVHRTNHKKVQGRLINQSNMTLLAKVSLSYILFTMNRLRNLIDVYQEVCALLHTYGV